MKQVKTYKLEIMDKDGNELSMNIEAVSSEEALSKARNKGFYPIRIKEQNNVKKEKKSCNNIFKSITSLLFK